MTTSRGGTEATGRSNAPAGTRGAAAPDPPAAGDPPPAGDPVDRDDLPLAGDAVAAGDRVDGDDSGPPDDPASGAVPRSNSVQLGELPGGPDRAEAGRRDGSSGPGTADGGPGAGGRRPDAADAEPAADGDGTGTEEDGARGTDDGAAPPEGTGPDAGERAPDGEESVGGDQGRQEAQGRGPAPASPAAGPAFGTSVTGVAATGPATTEAPVTGDLVRVAPVAGEPATGATAIRVGAGRAMLARAAGAGGPVTGGLIGDAKDARLLAGRVVTRPPAGPGKLPYLPALDGLRAVAVVLVIGYHMGWSGLAGGYIGVEVFFVLSGWLVCALLMGEHRAKGTISLRGFWLRRARRLLPAMVTVTVATLAVATAAEPERVAGLRSDALAALGYVLNWRLILDDHSYFAAADGPSALEHLWSLSIEEQFYLLFPLICGLVLVRQRRRVGVALALSGAVLATAARLAWSHPGVDPSRVYFGTDTRAAGLLAGVALGLIWVPGRRRAQPDRRVVLALDAVAVAGLGVVAWYALALSEQDGAAFGWGFTLVQAATLAVIAAVVVPAPTRASRALSAKPLQWVGRRSYGIYLIHWPVIVFTSRAPGQQPESLGRAAAQVGAVVVLSALSFTLIEQPIRRHGLVACGRRVRDGARRLLDGRPVVAAGALTGALAVAGLAVSVGHGVVTATDPGPPTAESVVISASPDPTTAPAARTPEGAEAPASPDAGTPAAGAPGTPAAAGATEPAVPAPPAPTFPPTSAVGDSVMVGAADALVARMGPSLGLDAAIGRQFNEAADLIRGMDGAGTLGEVVVIHLGNNGPFTQEQLDEVFAAIGPDRRVVLVTVFVPRRWEGEVNAALQAAPGRHPNARLVDWHAVAATEPGLLDTDGYHLSPAGRERYAEVVTTAITAS